MIRWGVEKLTYLSVSRGHVEAEGQARECCSRFGLGCVEDCVLCYCA